MRGKRKTPIITITAAKGGVGKSTTATCLATGLAKYHGKTILVVELDEQSSVCYQLGFGHNSGKHPTKGTVEFARGVPVKECLAKIYQAKPHRDDIPKGTIYIMAGSKDIKTLEEDIARGTVEESFGVKLEKIANANIFDVIIIDTPPSFHTLNDEAWVISDGVIFPVCPNDDESKASLRASYEFLKDVARKTGRAPSVIGVIQTKVNTQTRQGKKSSQMIKEVYDKNNLHLAMINSDAKVVEAAALKMSIFDYKEYSRAGVNYNIAVQKVAIWIDSFVSSYKRNQKKVAEA